MAFHNVSLDPDLAYGFEGGGSFSTIVQTTASGHEYRIARQAQMRHRYRAVKSLLTLEQFSELKDFFAARRGALHGFRFKDWQDFTTSEDGTGSPTATDVVLGTGDASNRDFQLIKTYDISGPAAYARVLTLPVAGSILVAVDGSPTTAFAISNPGGLITLDVAPDAGDVVSAGCQFEVPVRFAATNDEWMRARYASFASLEWEFELLEILDETEWPENWWPGGSAAQQNMSTDISMSANVKYWPLNPSINGLNAYLPPPDRIPGGEVFVVRVVSGAAGQVTIRDDAGASVVGPLSAGATRRIALARNGSTATWDAY